MMDWNDWIGKRVYLVLKNNRVYTGTVLSSDEGFLKIKDKFNKEVVINVSDITVIQDE
jgi:small nuclear ribonucleoprotein (snRNP)-like protein